MHLLVLGGTHGVGRLLADRAVAAGHAVATLGRREMPPAPNPEPGLTRLRGDARDPALVAAAMAGRDAVALCLGVGPTLRPVHLFSQATALVLREMRARGVRRVVAITGIGAGDSRGHGGFLYDRIFQPLLLGTAYADKDRQEALLRAATDLDWTILRPGFLVDEAPTGQVRARTRLAPGDIAGRITRADCADHTLRTLTAGLHLREAVLLDGYVAQL
jgi:nucleoside-diphosphate-sugar epimerase